MNILFRFKILFWILLFPIIINAQATLRVTVLSVQTLNNVDCDGLFLGNSDFVWEFTATDNSLGLTNNNPALFGIYNFNYGYKNNDNGPYSLVAPNGNFNPSNGKFFEHDYICPTDVPSAINLAWEAYENDDAGNYDILGFTDGETGIQNVVLPVPIAAGTLNYSFNAYSTDGACYQHYVINLSVERLPIVVSYLDDNICAANALALNTTYAFGWCSSTLETNEPAANDVQASGSAWGKFIAPASGSVQVLTDLPGTDIGTYIEIYHAADGASCTAGLHPVSGTPIKNKFEYLSHVDYSDGIDLLGFDPESDITFDACNPTPLISYQKLIPGETYYVQMTADNVTTNGYYQLRVNSFSGTAPTMEDIPCLAAPISYNTTVITPAQNSTPTTTMTFACAFDGGNSAGETGEQNTSANPNQYHAYDYQHIAAGNAVMNESIWLSFIAPQKGRIHFETDYLSALYGESEALFGFDKQFGPGVPTDFLCSNLKFLSSDEGGTNSFLGGDPSAKMDLRCLEPGYKYFGMMDPSDNITALSGQDISAWIYDPSISDPSLNPPGNDILCLALQDTLYEVPVIPANTNPTFQAVAGSNVLACREYLAGEPAIDQLPTNCANQTVWHYFTAPPSGAVELSIRAYIGMDLLRFNVFELLNGTNCYGGLQPATYTLDGTRYTPAITPIISGSATYNGHQETICCMEIGKMYAIQIDGGSAGDEGQYIIEYIKELESDAGDIYATISNGNNASILNLDTAFVCFGDTLTPGILVDGIGQSTASLPSCLSPGYVLHQIPLPANPIANSGFSFIDSIQGLNGNLINNGNGSGVFGNPLFNTLYYLSPAGDNPSNWGTFNCSSATVENGIPVVYLQALNTNFNYNTSTCTLSLTASGGLNSFNGAPYTYAITNPLGTVVANGTLMPNANFTYLAAMSGIYTMTVNDGACPQIFTFDASGCNNPCTPTTSNTSLVLCPGESVLLGGIQQNQAGTYTDYFTSTQGCDSIVITQLSFHPIIDPTLQQITICTGGTYSIGGNNYSTSGLYADTLSSITNCDSIVITSLNFSPMILNTLNQTICSGSTYNFNGQILTTTGFYSDTLISTGNCDSLILLSLMVNPPLSSYTNATICEGETYNFNGQAITQSGQFKDTITNGTGCDSVCVLELSVVSCIGDLQISNLLTPNGDNQNDTWKIDQPNLIKGCDVKIYNRWGQVLYETNDYNNEWDGTKNGDPLPDGVYFYSIQCKEQEWKGSLNLLRLKK